MHTTVILPFRPNPASPAASGEILTWVLHGYLSQQLASGHTMDVRVGIDGEEEPLPLSLPEDRRVTLHRLPHMGAAAVRNALVQETSAETELLVLGNADARPEPDMVQQHADAMKQLPPHSMVLGASPWERLNPTVLDTLIDNEPMIFSYCHMKPHRWYDFRCAYSLNLSVKRADYMAYGGFHDTMRPVYYEDLAFACRMIGPERKGVWHEPAARVLHRHPLALGPYLDREELLGLMAPVLHRLCPEAFARIMANRDIQDIARDFRARLASDLSVYRQIFRRVVERFAQPSAVLGEGDARRLAIKAAYQLHIPLKLLAFRLGFLKGLELVDDACWRERQPAGLWRKIVEP